MRRAYLEATARSPGLGIAFTMTNVAAEPIEIGAFGMAMPTAHAQDVHIGGSHGWVEWMCHTTSAHLVSSDQCVIATPLDTGSRLENFRPILEFGGGVTYEWAVHTGAWATEWEENRQWPYLYMAEALNATGIWPNPRSPWPGWGDGGATVRTNVTRETHWNAPTTRTLMPGENVTYGVRLSACPGGPRTRDLALAAVGEPVVRGVPGFTLSTDMRDATLLITLPPKLRATGATASNASCLHVGAPVTAVATTESHGANHTVRIPVRGLARGRSRVEVALSDGSSVVAHYLVLPPLPTQIERVSHHWSEVAWLPRDYPDDPFGRGASVLPWDREDGRHRFNDGRAYDVGLSDDAGAANNLGLATAQAFAPRPGAVGRLGEYIENTLYGIKNDTAKPPFKSLQLPEPDNGVRMTLFYYNQTYFGWNYTEADECGVVAGLNYNWCMTEAQANATYRGFNYPHQIAVWYAMYRTARNHPLIQVGRPWEYYLERAANTTVRLGYARIGYMDGTVTREVLRSVREEAAEADAGRAPPRMWRALADAITKGEASRAEYFKTAPNPYGSEFSYDTTGQEEVVVWLLYFGYDDAARRTVDHVLQYMRPLPNWAYNGGAQAGDVANGGKWLVTAGTGWGDSGKMHYRAGLNQIPLIEWYRRHPDDITALEIAVGAMSGQMGNIDEAGAPSIYFHVLPHVMEHDAYSGDYGLGFFGSSLESSATFVRDAVLGPLCYLCDHEASGGGGGGGGGMGGGVGATNDTIWPRDAYRQRVYLEPLGLYLQTDTGVFQSVTLDMAHRRIAVVFAPASATPARAQTYRRHRLRVDKLSQPSARRPGANFRVVASPSGPAVVRRSAFEVAASAVALTLVLAYDDVDNHA